MATLRPSPHRSWRRRLLAGPPGFLLALLAVPLLLVLTLPEALLALLAALLALPLRAVLPGAMPLLVRHLYMTSIGRLHILLLKALNGSKRHSRVVRVECPRVGYSREGGGGEDVAVFPLPMLADNYCYLVVNNREGQRLRGEAAAEALARHRRGLRLGKRLMQGEKDELDGPQAQGELVVDFLPAFLVDPCDAQAVGELVREVEQAHYGTGGVQVCIDVRDIFTTHKHWDHAGGNRELLRHLPRCGRCFASGLDKVFGTTHHIEDGDLVQSCGLAVEIMETEYHTEGSLTFVLRSAVEVLGPEEEITSSLAFTGDALFIGGCGAAFEGTERELLSTFWRIRRRLSPATLLFPGHEYTTVLLGQRLGSKPAAKLDLQNFQLLSSLYYRACHCRRLRFPMPTVPARLGEEVCHNPHFTELEIMARILQRCWRVRCRLGLGGVGDAATANGFLGDDCDADGPGHRDSFGTAGFAAESDEPETGVELPPLAPMPRLRLDDHQTAESRGKGPERPEAEGIKSEEPQEPEVPQELQDPEALGAPSASVQGTQGAHGDEEYGSEAKAGDEKHAEEARIPGTEAPDDQQSTAQEAGDAAAFQAFLQESPVRASGSNPSTAETVGGDGASDVLSPPDQPRLAPDENSSDAKTPARFPALQRPKASPMSPLQVSIKGTGAVTPETEAEARRQAVGLSTPVSSPHDQEAKTPTSNPRRPYWLAKRPSPKSHSGRRQPPANASIHAARPVKVLGAVIHSHQIGAPFIFGFRAEAEAAQRRLVRPDPQLPPVEAARRGTGHAKLRLRSLLRGGDNTTCIGRPARALQPHVSGLEIEPGPKPYMYTADEDSLIHLGVPTQRDGRGQKVPPQKWARSLHEPEPVLAQAFSILGDELQAEKMGEVPCLDRRALEMALRSFGDVPLSQKEFRALWTFLVAAAAWREKHVRKRKSGTGDEEAPVLLNAQVAAEVLSLVEPPEKHPCVGMCVRKTTCGFLGNRRTNPVPAAASYADGASEDGTEESEPLVNGTAAGRDKGTNQDEGGAPSRRLSKITPDQAFLLPFTHTPQTCRLCVAYVPPGQS